MICAKDRQVRLGALFRRRDETGKPEMPLLSVYREYGVTPREGRDDNYNKPGENLNAYRVVHRGDLVMNKMKTWQGSLGISDYDGIVSPAYFVARPLTNDSPAYLHHLLRSRPLIAEYGARSKGIRPSQWDLPWDEFREISVSLPSLPAQRAIADYLDRETARIDALIAAKQRMAELLEDRRTIVLLEACRPTSTPTTWSRTRLKYLFDSVQAGTWGSDPEGTVDDVLCVRVADFDRTRLAVDAGASTLRSVPPGERTRRALQRGDVLIEKSGGGAAQPVGFAVRFDLPARAVCSNFVARLRPALRINPMYVAFVLAAAYRARLNIPYVKQTTGIQNLDLSAYLAISWMLPPSAGQSAIVDRLTREFAKIDLLNHTLVTQVDLLRERRESLITAAVTGELDIPEAA